jgi:hypothetical protein
MRFEASDRTYLEQLVPGVIGAGYVVAVLIHELHGKQLLGVAE